MAVCQTNRCSQPSAAPTSFVFIQAQRGSVGAIGGYDGREGGGSGKPAIVGLALAGRASVHSPDLFCQEYCPPGKSRSYGNRIHGHKKAPPALTGGAFYSAWIKREV